MPRSLARKDAGRHGSSVVARQAQARIAEQHDFQALEKDARRPAARAASWRVMKRRTLARHRDPKSSAHHHSVYVVLLAAAVGRLRQVQAANPARDAQKPCVYVGMTGLTPEARFANHQAGTQDAPLVRRYGLRLLPELYAHLNPMPYAAACRWRRTWLGICAGPVTP